MNEPIKIALVGSPNAGKSSLFNLLTGLSQKVGNFPGVTVDRKTGSFESGKKKYKVIDLPGCYSLYSRAEDERITSSVLLEKNHPDYPDLVLLVGDHSNLKRSLVLAGQVHDLGFPMIVVMNMADLVKDKNAEEETKRIATGSGFDILSISVLKKTGIAELQKKLAEFKPAPVQKQKNIFTIPASFLPALEKTKEISGAGDDYAAWMRLLGGSNSQDTESKISAIRKEFSIEDTDSWKANELVVRNENAAEWINTKSEPNKKREIDLSSRLDKVLLHPVLGYLIFLGILVLVFQAIFAWAKYPMDLIDVGFSAVGTFLKGILPAHFVTDLFVEGIWSGIGGILVFIPQIAFLFMFIALLEESGYMSRVVFLMDRIMRPFGFSGKSVIPLIGGMACAVPSIMMARSISDLKERLITILVTPLMSCSARLPVYTLIIGMFVPEKQVWWIFNQQGLFLLAMYLLGFFTSLLVALIFKVLIKQKGLSFFLTELPPFRTPGLKNVLTTIYSKCRTFVVETGKIILVISALLWILASTGPSGSIQQVSIQFQQIREEKIWTETESDSLAISEASAKLKTSWAGRMGGFIEPVISPLGFDWKIGICLITSFAAREVFVSTMATLYSTGEGDKGIADLQKNMQAEINPKTGKPVYTAATGMALLIFYAFAMQCMSTIAVVKRETASWKWPLIMTAYMTALAWVGAFAVFQIFSRM